MKLPVVAVMLISLFISIILCSCTKKTIESKPAETKPLAVNAFNWEAVAVYFDDDLLQRDFDDKQLRKLQKSYTLRTDSSDPIIEFPRFLKIQDNRIYFYDKYLGQVVVFDHNGNYLWSSQSIEANSKELILDMDVASDDRIVLKSANKLFFLHKSGKVHKQNHSGQGCLYMPKSIFSVNNAKRLGAGMPLVSEVSTRGAFIKSYGNYNFADAKQKGAKYNFRLWQEGSELYVWNSDLPEISIIDTLSNEQSLVRLQHPVFIKRGMFNTDTYVGSDTTLGIFTIFADIEVHGSRIFALIENDEIMMIAEIAKSGEIVKLYTCSITSRETVLDFAVELSNNMPTFWVIIGSPMRMNVYRFEELR